MTNLNTKLQNKKLLITKIVIIMNKNYNWSLHWFPNLTTKGNLLLNISYKVFLPQKVISKLVSK